MQANATVAARSGSTMDQDQQVRGSAPETQPAATPAAGPAPAAAPGGDIAGLPGYAAQRQATQPPGTGYSGQRAAVAPAGLGRATVTTPALNVRDKPAVQGTRIGVARQGDALPVTANADGWLGVRFMDGIGFVAKPYTKVVADPAAAPALERTQRKGLPNIKKPKERKTKDRGRPCHRDHHECNENAADLVDHDVLRVRIRIRDSLVSPGSPSDQPYEGQGVKETIPSRKENKKKTE